MNFIQQKGMKIMSHLENEQEKKTDNRSPIKTIFDKFANNKDVTLIYGEPITYEKQCIVPVAKMNYSFGAGSGGETNIEEDGDKTEDQGEGGGGHITVKPIGVYQMTASGVQFKPVSDMKPTLTIFTFLILGMTFLLRKK